MKTYFSIPNRGTSVLVCTLAVIAGISAPSLAQAPQKDAWPPAPPLKPEYGSDVATLPRSVTAAPAGPSEFTASFRFKPEAEAKRVMLVGSFNNWDRDANPMAGPNKDGDWTAEIKLGAGSHQYKFLMDEDSWRPDPANPEQAPDGHGGFNSLLRLGRTASLQQSDGKIGDGKIDVPALLHRAPEQLFVYPLTSTTVSLRYRTLAHDVKSVTLALKGQPSKPMKVIAEGPIFNYWEATVEFPGQNGGKKEPPGLDYTFILDDGQGQFSDPYTYHYTHLGKDPFQTPEWTKHAVWYQIVPDRFRNGDKANDPDRVRPWTSEWFTPSEWEGKDGQTFYQFFAFARFYGGDFAGIEEKLAYLKELGVNAIYLTPIFEAPSYHKYDLASYIHVDDDLGVKGSYEQATKNEDLLNPASWQWSESDKRFLDFLKKAHEQGFRVILDAVFNHCGDDHPAFRDVRQVGKQSRFGDWFDVTSWTPFSYKGWAGFAHMPVYKKDTNGFASETLKKHLFAVTKRWMDPNGDGDPSDGIDGWRLDVPNDIPRAFWAEWRQFVKKTRPDAFITGEVWHRADQWLDGDHFDAVMNYEFARTAVMWIFDKDKKISASAAAGRFAELLIAYPDSANYSLQNVIDSHDTDRLASMAMNPDREYDRQNRVQDNNPDYKQGRPAPEAYAKARLATLLQMTYVGAPLLFYGSEAGMFGADDPSNRKPMLWKDLEPYEKKEENFVLEDQLAFFKKAGALRNQYAALRVGSLETLLTDDAADVWAFRRADDKDQLIVVLNASNKEAKVAIPLPEGAAQQWKKVFGGEGTLPAAGGKLEVAVPALGGVVLQAPK